MCIRDSEKSAYLLDLRNSGKNICAPYAEKFPEAKFIAGKKPWGVCQDFDVKVDLFIPCAMQNDVHMEDAKNIVESGCKFYCEGDVYKRQQLCRFRCIPTLSHQKDFFRKICES